MWNPRHHLLFGSLLVLLSMDLHAELYRYVSPDGVTHLSSKALGPGYRSLSGSAKHKARSRILSPEALQSAVDRAAHRYQVNQSLILSVILAESGYDAGAVSRKGALGLMQLMPATAAHYGVRDPFDPAQNIAAGTRHLRHLLERFRDLELALAAYNAGESAIVRNGYQIPPYAETRHYVRKVLKHFRRRLRR